MTTCIITVIVILVIIIAIIRSRKTGNNVPDTPSNSIEKKTSQHTLTEKSASDVKLTDSNYTYNNDDQPLFDQEDLKEALKNNQKKP